MRSDGGYEKFECLTYEHLTSYLDGTLEPRAFEACEWQLASCNRCALAFEALKHLLNDELTPEEKNVIEMVGPGRLFRFGCSSRERLPG